MSEGLPYGLMAEFERPEQLVPAITDLRQAGFRRIESYSPYPVEGLAEALDFSPWLVPTIFLITSLLGAGAGFFMQLYASYDYPINVGGRPLNSWPSFIPITFELAVLGGVFGGVLGMVLLNGLPRYSHPVSNVQRFGASSSDAYFVCIETSDPKYDRQTLTELLQRCGALHILEVPR